MPGGVTPPPANAGMMVNQLADIRGDLAETWGKFEVGING